MTDGNGRDARAPAGPSADDPTTSTMTRDQTAYIAGAYEHPTREAPDKSIAQLHADAAAGALADAGLSSGEVDGYFTAGENYQVGRYPPLAMADYLGLDVSYFDSTDDGGSAYVNHVGEAASAVARGKCDVALVTLAGRMRTYEPDPPEHGDRIMQENFEEVVESRTVADPLHLLDCCVVSDGAGAFVVVSDEVRRGIDRETVEILGHGVAVDHHDAGRIDLTTTAAERSGPRAFAEAGLDPADVDYASVYDSFTITVLQTLEDLGFCEKGRGGEFVEGGTLQAPDGELPFNTDGGGLCSNHPDRGGMTKVIEAVRQLRGEANPEVQVPDAEVALAHGTGGYLGTRHAGSTALLGRVGR